MLILAFWAMLLASTASRDACIVEQQVQAIMQDPATQGTLNHLTPAQREAVAARYRTIITERSLPSVRQSYDLLVQRGAPDVCGEGR